MISKPPNIKDSIEQERYEDIELWMTEVKHKFDNYLASLFFPVSTRGTGTAVLVGNHPAMELDSGEIAYIGAVFPSGLENIREAGIRLIPTTTGSFNYTVDMTYGGVGQSHSNTSETQSATGYALTNNFVTEVNLPLTTFFLEIEKGDQIGIKLTVDALTTTTKINVLGFYLKFN